VFVLVPVEEPALVEYFTEANRSDLLSSASGRHRPMTVVVCQSGDEVKFYQFLPTTNLTSPASFPHRYTSTVEPVMIEINKKAQLTQRERATAVHV